MFSLVIKGLDTNQLLDLDFYHIRDCGYDVALHFNEDNGLFNVGLGKENAFSFRLADDTLYLTGGLELIYYGTCIFYREDDVDKAVKEEWSY